MSSSQKLEDALRAAIIAKPDAILDDHDVMRALIGANERAMGGNIVDMRGIAMDRLENRLDRLENTHQSVIAAAYENLAGTNQVHRAILRMLDANDFEQFLHDLGEDVAEILRVDTVALVLESADPAGRQHDGILTVENPGFIDSYLTRDRGNAPRQITLRPVDGASELVYGRAAEWIRSEACLKLDLGADRLPGMLLLGSEDPKQFSPQQGTDLMAFFTGVLERSMRRWLS